MNIYKEASVQKRRVSQEIGEVVVVPWESIDFGLHWLEQLAIIVNDFCLVATVTGYSAVRKKRQRAQMGFEVIADVDEMWQQQCGPGC